MPAVFFYGIIFSIGSIVLFYGGDIVDGGDLDMLVGETVYLEGKAISERDVRDNSVILLIESSQVTNKDKTIFITTPTRIRISFEYVQQINFGDAVTLGGVLKKPKNFNNDNGIEFDYVSFLAKDDVYYVMSRPRNVAVSPREKTTFLSALFSFKELFVSKMNQVLESPHSSLLAGLLLGVKQSLGSELLDKFRIVGLIHIVVLSGYNVTIVARAIERIFSWLPKQISFTFGILSIVCFAIITGLGATIIRASIMAGIGLFSRSSSNIYNVHRTLYLAGFLMVLHNPIIFFHDPSFQLSFVATLGLIHLAPFFEKICSFVTPVLGLREIVATTFAAQVSVLPLLMHMSGDVSLISPLVNVLVLPVVALVMLVGFITILVAFMSPIISIPFALVAHVILEYIFIIVEWGSSFSFSIIKIPTVSAWMTVGIYICVGLIMSYKHIRSYNMMKREYNSAL